MEGITNMPETSQMMVRASEDPEYLKDNIVAILSHQNRFCRVQSQLHLPTPGRTSNSSSVDILQTQKLTCARRHQKVAQTLTKDKAHAELEELEQSVFKVN